MANMRNIWRKEVYLLMDEASMKLLMTGLTVAVGGSMPALAIGLLTSKAMEAIGRNPEAAGEVRTSMILGVAFAEEIGRASCRERV